MVVTGVSVISLVAIVTLITGLTYNTYGSFISLAAITLILMPVLIAGIVLLCLGHAELSSNNANSTIVMPRNSPCDNSCPIYT